MFDFSDHFNALAADATFGEALLVTPKDGTELHLDGRWRSEKPTEETDERGERQARRDSVIVRLVDLANPERGMTVKRKRTGETWTVSADPEDLNGVAWELPLSRTKTTRRGAGLGGTP